MPLSLARTIVREGNTLFSSVEPAGERESLGSLLRRNAARFDRHPIYLERRGDRFEPVAWSDFARAVVSVMTFLQSRGVTAGDRVAVVSRNRGEMLIAEFAVMSLGAVWVPIFAGYSGEQTTTLLAQSDAIALLVSDRSHLEKSVLPDRVRLVVGFDPLPRAATGRTARPSGCEYVDFTEVLGQEGSRGPTTTEMGRALDEAARARPSDPCLMMYTSGTAGQQKGVLLTHDNILSQQRALATIWQIDTGDRLLSYLPWHHSFGGIFEKYTAIYRGAPLALDDSHGKDLARLKANWKLVRPTVYFSVPLVYQELVNHVRLHPGDEREIFHDGLRFVFTAAAPLPSNLSDYFAARGIPVVEGWGLTETSPCCTLTDMSEPRSTPGVVGYPIPGVHVRLAEDGEILVRGPNVMCGYDHNPEATARALPGDGWLHTGDLGEISGSALRLLTRKDRVFKLLNAEKVVPTALEITLAGANKYIRHVLVVGDGREFLAALIYPNVALIEAEFGADVDTADRVVRESYRESIRTLNDHNPVKYEHLHAFAVVSRELSVENGDLTPSLKIRVQNVLRSSVEYIDAIYDPLNDCDCCFLRRVVRLVPDSRECPAGEPLTLDRCYECIAPREPRRKGEPR